MQSFSTQEIFLPSPTLSAVALGPLTIRFYALCILAGIAVGTWLTVRRLKARGGTSSQALDIVMWAVPFGIVGGRLYHVITDNQFYFGPGKDPWRALRIWEGGLGWGAVALGLVGAAIGARRAGVRFAAFADAAAPGLLLAQALGQVGKLVQQRNLWRTHGPAMETANPHHGPNHRTGCYHSRRGP